LKENFRYRQNKIFENKLYKTCANNGYNKNQICLLPTYAKEAVQKQRRIYRRKVLARQGLALQKPPLAQNKKTTSR